jgi:hypothetical protein
MASPLAHALAHRTPNPLNPEEAVAHGSGPALVPAH